MTFGSFLRVLVTTALACALACGSDPPAARDAGRDGGSLPDGSLPDGGSDAGPTRWTCGANGPDPRFLSDFGAWQPGFVLPGARGVNALATGPDGSLYLGGGFVHVSGVPARHVARLAPDGSVSALADGVPDDVTALTAGADAIYAATGVPPEGWSLLSLEERDTAIARIHRFDGTAWTEVVTIEGGAVFDLATDADGRLYAVGDFLSIGGVEAHHFAVLEGGVWREVQRFAYAATALVAREDGICYAGWATEKRMTVACGVPGAFVELPLPADFAPRLLIGGGGFFAVAPPIATMTLDSTGALVIGGSFVFAGFEDGLGSIARWNGTAFEAIGGVGYDPSRDFADWGVVQDLALDRDGSIVVAGDYTRAGRVDSAEMHGLARVRDGVWTDIPSGRLGSAGLSAGARVGIGRFRAAALAPGGVAVTGWFSSIEGVASFDIAIRGESWTSLGETEDLRGLDGAVLALASHAGTLYAGGGFVSDGSGTEHAFLASYRDGAWSEEGELPGAVYEIAIEADGTLWTVVAPGEFFSPLALYRSDGEAHAEIGRAELDSFMEAPWITSIAVAGEDRVYVAGRFERIAGVAVTNVAEIAGGVVRPLGAGVDGRVEGLAIDEDGSLIAVGHFENAGGSPARHVARWRDGAWQPLGEGISTLLSSVTTLHGSIVVSAIFDTFDVGPSDPLVACFDGTAWHDVASSAIPAVSGGTTRLFAMEGTLVLVGQIPRSATDLTLSTKVAVFAGDSWTPIDMGRGDFAYDAASTDTGFWLGGSFSSAGGVPADQIAFFEFELD